MLGVVIMLVAAQPQGPVRIAVPGLSLSGLEAKLGEAYVERFATLLGKSPLLRVTTRRDIEQLLGLERQKQLLGCEEGGSSCLAELAGGLGVDAMLSGSLAKTGSSYTITLRVLRASDGSQIAASSERLEDEDALSDWLEAEAPRLSEKITSAFGRAPASTSHLERWVPAFVGVGLLAVGGGLQAGARLDADSLNAGTVPLAQTSSILERGQALETTSWVLIGVGAAGVAASVTWVLLGKDATPIAVVPVQGGAFVSISGAFP